jgi:serine/threonine-protein kinase
MKCPSCSRELLAEAKFCAACGTAADSGDLMTMASGGGEQPPIARPPSSDSADYGRFFPGTVLAGRYRILALLGRGGMGEVYKADDIRLGQVVALKFLPAALARDPSRIASLASEVRAARQVSHPNVCRVYDLAEMDGEHFISMEFVDGEDLASLLRRIGRLADGKAIQIARQICEGLAAAHDRGILHRDLKPSNVMIDGRGDARIADFGLAGFAAHQSTADFSGTPAYMAPEQFAGAQASTHSDVYALGLVLYEIFTGVAAVRGASVADYAAVHRQHTPVTPSSLVSGMDPLVERVILRCLEKVPAARLPDARSVAAALPGGDPLAAAIALGQTPSPRAVAAAAQDGSLSRRVSSLLLAGALLGMALAAVLADRSSWYRSLPLDRPPEVLAQRARDILAGLGYTMPLRGDIAAGFLPSDYVGHLRDIRQTSIPRTALTGNGPPVILYWFRSGPGLLQSTKFWNAGGVAPDEPPLIAPGSIELRLDLAGNLHSLSVVPEEQPRTGKATPPDWAKAFELAGLGLHAFKATSPEWTPRSYADARAAWSGAYGDPLSTPVRIEAAALEGRLVSFRRVMSWTVPASAPRPLPARADLFIAIALVALLLTFIVGTLWLARHTIRSKSGDSRGALRVGVAMFVLTALSAILSAHYASRGGFSGVVLSGLPVMALSVSWALVVAALTWIMYIALEPFARGTWPHSMISWSRLLDGMYHDRLVWRDVLIGAFAGASQVLIEGVPAFASTDAFLSAAPELGALLGWRFAASSVVGALQSAILMALVVFITICLPIRLLKRRWAGFTLIFVFVALFFLDQYRDGQRLAALASVLGLLLTVGVLLRFGLVAFVTAIFYEILFGGLVETTDLAKWYSGPSAFGLLLLSAIAVYAFRQTRGPVPQPIVEHAIQA